MLFHNLCRQYRPTINLVFTEQTVRGAYISVLIVGVIAELETMKRYGGLFHPMLASGR